MMIHVKIYRPIKIISKQNLRPINFRESSPITRETEGHEKARYVARKKSTFSVLVDPRKCTRRTAIIEAAVNSVGIDCPWLAKK